MAYRLYCGVDMSLRSPAMTVYDCVTFSFTVYFVSKNSRDRKLDGIQLQIGPNARSLKMVAMTSPAIRQRRATNLAHAHSSCLDENKRDSPYCAISYFRGILRKQIGLGIAPSEIKFCLEGYAFGLFGKSSSVSALCEVTGALKYILQEEGITVLVCSPSAVKKAFCGNGKATKRDMMKAFDDQCQAAALDTLESLPGARLRVFTLSHLSLTPASDIVDSFAVASYAMLSLQ